MVPFGGVRQQPSISASSRKLQDSSLPEPTAPADGSATGYRLIDLAKLQMYVVSILGHLRRRCHSNNVVLSEKEYKRSRPIMSVLMIKCLECKKLREEFETSPLRPIVYNRSKEL